MLLVRYDASRIDEAKMASQITEEIHVLKAISCNHGHNILRLFDVLSYFPFATSDTKRDY